MLERLRSAVYTVAAGLIFIGFVNFAYPFLEPILIAQLPPEYVSYLNNKFAPYALGCVVLLLIGLIFTKTSGSSSSSDYKSHFELAVEGKFRTTPEGRFLDANKALLSMLGYRNKQELLELDINKKLYVDKKEREQLLNEYKSKGMVKGMIVRWRRKDGAPIYVQLFARSAGSFYEGLAVDISRSKRTQNSLAASQQQLETLVEDAFFGICIVQDNLIRYNNAKLAEMFGYDPKKFKLDMALSALIETGSRGKVIEQTRRLHDGDSATVRFTADGQKRDESVISLQIHGALTEYQGRSAIICTIMDISLLTKAATELKRSKEEYHGIVDTIKEVICKLDVYGNFTFLTPAWKDITGYDIDESVNKSLTSFVHPWKRDEFVAEFDGILGQQVDEVRIESMILRKDSDHRWLEVNVQTIRNSLGEVTGIAGILEDITIQKTAEQELTESRERYRKLVETMHDGLVIQDQDGLITYANNRFCELIGHARDSILSQNLQDYMDEEGADEVSRHLAKKNIVTGTSLEVDWIRSTGGRISTITSPQRIGDVSGKKESFMLVTDITDRKVAEEALKESEERYALAAEGANDGLWDWDLRTNKLYLSPRWSDMLGYTLNEFGDTPDDWFKRVHPEDLPNLKLELKAHLNDESQRLENEHRVLHKDGKYRWMLVRGVAVKEQNIKASRLAGSLTDITERKEHEQALWREAFYDTLTDLPNRALFKERLERALARSARHPEHLFAVMFLDLDRFKWVNDSLGHLVGDKLLVGIARRLETCLRPGDTVARMGGDEFNILLDDIHDVDEAIHVADRIKEALAKPFDLDDNEVFTSTSIGISLSSNGYESVEDILRDADTALYKAKAAGKCCHSVFDQSMHAQAVDRMTIENDLRRALEREQLIMLYQPIIDVNTELVRGFEALIRWEHPTRGLIFPTDFVHIAEETGDILAIGEWAIRESCEKMASWSKNYTDQLTMNVNLSSKQLSQPNIDKIIAEILAENKLAPELLRLEITESVIMQHGDPGIQTLEKMKDIGIHLCIDDFGTGYSSLSYLHRFPIDILKVDRSFVAQMDSDKEKFEIVKAIISLSHSLGLYVTAEGVENINQLSMLKQLNCELAQGYHISAAVKSDEIVRMLEKQSKLIQANASKTA